MTAVKRETEETNTQIQNGQDTNGHQPAAPTRTFKSDPPPGRKLSREEALDYVFDKNEELLRRLA